MKSCASFRRLAAWLVLILGGCIGSTPAFAQSYVTVTGSHVVNAAGTPLASGTLNICPVDGKGLPLAFHIGGGATGMSACVAVQVTNGAFSTQLPDTALTNPANVCLAFSVQDPTTYTEDLPGYTCVQPSNQASSAAVTAGWCTSGGSCNLDNYVPSTTPVPLSSSVSYTQGLGAPGGSCGANSIYANLSSTPIVLYACRSGAWTQIAGGGSSGGSSTPSALYFTDTATGTEYSLTIASGALSRTVASGGSPVGSVCFTDAASGAQTSLAITNGALTKTVGSCSGAVASVQLADTSTSSIYALAFTNAALTRTLQ